MVHHDIWDYDNATAPKLLTVRHNGKMVDVVAQAGKTGFLYVFDRVTGEPLWPIEERPVPRATCRAKGLADAAFPDCASAIRAADVHRKGPESVHRRPRREAPASSRTSAARATKGCSRRPGSGNTIEMPGNNGGSNFGGAAVDPEHGTDVRGVEGLAGACSKLSAAGRSDGAGRCRQAIVRYESPFGFMVTSSGLIGNRAAVDDDDGVRPQRGDDQVEDPARRSTGARRKRDHATRVLTFQRSGRS